MPRSTTRFAYEAEFYRLQLEPYSAVTSDLLLVFRDNSNTTLVQTSR